MKRICSVISGLLLFSCLSAFSCRFTVREVGFADVVPQFYHLYCYVDNQTEAGIISAFNQSTFTYFIDTNVKSKVINIDQFGNPHPSKYFKEWDSEKLPTVVLVSPNDTPIPFLLPSHKNGIRSLVERIIRSNMRDQIIKAAIQTYGVVLLVEGKNSAENRQAHSAIRVAIEQIKDKIPEMPKPVSELPRIITLSYQKRDQEKILLWSLTGEIELVGGPFAIVLYGRGRQIGPLMEGNQITTANLVNTLSLIGADCECGLDRSTMLGTMIPLKWDQSMQADLVKQLGFDPESPMIKNEISQILSRTPVSPGQSISEDPLLGYTEFTVTFESESAIELVKEEADSLVDPDIPESFDSIVPPIWLSLIIVILLGLAIFNSGILVFLRKRKNS